MPNTERIRTRDLLLEYDFSILPPRPRVAGLRMIYPWENETVTSFTHLLYECAAASGYTGTENEFANHFGSLLGNKQIIFGTMQDFIGHGDSEYLYFDIADNILYYFEDEEFVPINTLLIPGTILDSGNAEEDE